jgi:hypothetical protein
MRSSSPTKAILPSAILIVAAYANSISGAGRTGTMTPSVSAQPTALTSSPSLASAAPTSVEGDGNTIGEIELGLASADCSDSGHGGSGSGVSGNSNDCPEIELDPVGVASWFRGTGGTVLDPSSPASAFAIGQSIKLSFAAFEDADRNGIEDRR